MENFNTRAAVIIYSGGMDSFTLLHKVIRSGVAVYPLSFNYGQRHSKELDCARRVCSELKLDHKVVDISDVRLLLGGCALTSDVPVPEKGYRSEKGELTTVVPYRNMMLLSIALGYASTIGAAAVYYGPHRDDASVYLDCRPEFVSAMNDLITVSGKAKLRIVAPFLFYSKKDILKEGIAMGLDYATTWTCYNGNAKACGRCGACIDRLKSFAAMNLEDPIEYEALDKVQCQSL